MIWQPRPLSTYHFAEDVESVSYDPRIADDQLTCTTVHAERVGYKLHVPPHPDAWLALQRTVNQLDRGLHAELVRSGRVADRSRWGLRIDVGPELTTVTAHTTAWPAIPGWTTQDPR